MGWGVIERNYGGGYYAVTTDDGDFTAMWCCDYTVDIPVGTKVGTIEIQRRSFSMTDRMIRPGRCSWQNTQWRTTDGTVTPARQIKTAAAVVLAAMFSEAAEFWKPNYGYGSVVDVDHDGNQVRVQNYSLELPMDNWVPVDYMTQGAKVFQIGDQAVVEMRERVAVKVIGFRDTPAEDEPVGEDEEDDITCGSACAGQEDCPCCVDPDSEACQTFCRDNPDHKTCKAIENPAQADTATLCYPCSPLRELACQAQGTGKKGCECVDDPGLAICRECCQFKPCTDACARYCKLNPDDPLCLARTRSFFCNTSSCLDLTPPSGYDMVAHGFPLDCTAVSGSVNWSEANPQSWFRLSFYLPTLQYALYSTPYVGDGNTSLWRNCTTFVRYPSKWTIYMNTGTRFQGLLYFDDAGEIQEKIVEGVGGYYQFLALRYAVSVAIKSTALKAIGFSPVKMTSFIFGCAPRRGRAAVYIDCVTTRGIDTNDLTSLPFLCNAGDWEYKTFQQALSKDPSIIDYAKEFTVPMWGRKRTFGSVFITLPTLTNIGNGPEIINYYRLVSLLQTTYGESRELSYSGNTGFSADFNSNFACPTCPDI